MIWQMGELGYNYNKWCSSEGVDYTGTKEHETDRKPVKWEYYDVPERKAVYDVYCKMNDLRMDNPDLFGKNAYYTGVDSYSMSSWPVKGFSLDKNGKKVYGYANYHGEGAGSETINIPGGTWTDILSGKTVQGGSYILNSGEALVLVNSSVIR